MKADLKLLVKEREDLERRIGESVREIVSKMSDGELRFLLASGVSGEAYKAALQEYAKRRSGAENKPVKASGRNLDGDEAGCEAA